MRSEPRFGSILVVAVAVALVASPGAARGDEEARLPINPFAKAEKGDWCALTGTASAGGKELSRSLTFEIAAAGPERVTLMTEGDGFAQPVSEIDRREAPTVKAFFQATGFGTAIVDVAVTEEKRTVPGREFACKKLAFTLLAPGGPALFFSVWFCEEVKGAGIVALSSWSVWDGTKVTFEIELAGYGTAQATVWERPKAPAGPPADLPPEAAALLPLELPAVGGTAHDPDTLPVLTVHVAANGRVASGGLVRKAPWRGLGLPIDKGLEDGPGGGVVLEEIRIFVLPGESGAVELRVGAQRVGSVREAVDLAVLALEDYEKLGQRAPVIVDADPRVPFLPVAELTAELVERTKVTPEFAAPLPAVGADPPGRRTRDAVRALIAAMPGIEEEGVSRLRLALRIRADARATWGDVGGALNGAAEAGIWRFTFAVRGADGGERDLFATGNPAARSAPLVELEVPKRSRPGDPPFPGDRPGPLDEPVPDEPRIFFPGAEEVPESEGEDYGQMKGDPGDHMGVGGGGGGATPYGGRMGGRRNLVAWNGGSQATESAVLAGLRWLARHQREDGVFPAETYADKCPAGGKCAGAGYSQFDVGTTGLALLAFLGGGYSHLSRQVYEDAYTHEPIAFGKVIRKGLDYLVSVQDDEGCFGPRTGEFMYNHAIATLALAEAYGMTNAAMYKAPTQKAVDFLLAAQNPGIGWRYHVKPGDNDTSVTGWCTLALKAAELAGIAVPRAAYDGTKAWLDRVTDKDTGEVGYNGRGMVDVIVRGKNEAWGPHPTMTALALYLRILIDKDRKDPILAKHAALVAKDLPVWDEEKHTVDLYYWYAGTLALFQWDAPGGESWKAWNKAVQEALVTHQKQKADGCADGSWDPAADRWGFAGGRVYTTALGVLTLETYYRYEAIKAPRPATAPGPEPGPETPAAKLEQARKLAKEAGMRFREAERRSDTDRAGAVAEIEESIAMLDLALAIYEKLLADRQGDAYDYLVDEIEKGVLELKTYRNRLKELTE